VARDPDPEWVFPPWWKDKSSLVGKVNIPEAGGWMYQFRDSAGLFSHVFVPDLSSWANAIAYAISPPKNVPVAVVSDFASATHRKQSVPDS
jgi:hypothetical protein